VDWRSYISRKQCSVVPWKAVLASWHPRLAREGFDVFEFRIADVHRGQAWVNFTHWSVGPGEASRMAATWSTIRGLSANYRPTGVQQKKMRPTGPKLRLAIAYLLVDKFWLSKRVTTEFYANRNDLDKAFAWLDRAYQLHDGWVPWVPWDPLLKNLQNDPRYKTYLRKMNLPD